MKLRAHGFDVRPMVWNRQKQDSQDCIHHTVKHFLSADGRWEDVQPHPDAPPDTLHPAHARRDVEARHWALGPGSETDTAWRSPPRVEVVLKIHEAGYFPRYAGLIFRAGDPRNPGSYWHKDGRGCLRAFVDNFKVVIVRPHSDGERPDAEAVTAHWMNTTVRDAPLPAKRPLTQNLGAVFASTFTLAHRDVRSPTERASSERAGPKLEPQGQGRRG